MIVILCPVTFCNTPANFADIIPCRNTCAQTSNSIPVPPCTPAHFHALLVLPELSGTSGPHFVQFPGLDPVSKIFIQ